eukprot:NODE_887_length_3432_cov_0.206421.p1 type:complete len:230 gc:universal NODE_887_length_3432_cov_0.206421:758-1447(+)
MTHAEIKNAQCLQSTQGGILILTGAGRILIGDIAMHLIGVRHAKELSGHNSKGVQRVDRCVNSSSQKWINTQLLAMKLIFVLATVFAQSANLTENQNANSAAIQTGTAATKTEPAAIQTETAATKTEPAANEVQGFRPTTYKPPTGSETAETRVECDKSKEALIAVGVDIKTYNYSGSRELCVQHPTECLNNWKACHVNIDGLSTDTIDVIFERYIKGEYILPTTLQTQ